MDKNSPNKAMEEKRLIFFHEKVNPVLGDLEATTVIHKLENDNYSISHVNHKHSFATYEKTTNFWGAIDTIYDKLHMFDPNVEPYNFFSRDELGSYANSHPDLFLKFSLDDGLITIREEFGYKIQKGGSNSDPVFHIVDPTDTCIMRKKTERTANKYLNDVLKTAGIKKDQDQQHKFPINQAQIAGKIVGKFNDQPDQSRITFSVHISKGKNQGNSSFIKCVVSGKERYDNFKKDFEQYLENNGQGKNNYSTQDLPYVKLSGQAYFSKNKDEEKGVTHSNYALIVTGKLDKQSENYQMPQTKEEIEAFIKQNNGLNLESNKLEIRGNIASEIKISVSGNGRECATFSLAYNYITGEKSGSKTMYASVMIPAESIKSFKSHNFTKGSAIKLLGVPEPGKYTDSKSRTVYTVTLMGKEINPDLRRSTVNVKPVEKNTDNSAILKASEGLSKNKRSQGVIKQNKNDLSL